MGGEEEDSLKNEGLEMETETGVKTPDEMDSNSHEDHAGSGWRGVTARRKTGASSRIQIGRLVWFPTCNSEEPVATSCHVKENPSKCVCSSMTFGASIFSICIQHRCIYK